MTSDLAFTLFRLGFLVLLWILVLSIVATLRRDIYGTVVTPRGSGRAKAGSRKKREKKKTASASGSPTRLLVTGGPLTGTILPLGSVPLTIGRSTSATLVLEDPYASSNHAELVNVDGQWVLYDQGSTNGTYVDDERVAGPKPLAPGVGVRIGQTTFELVN